MNSRDKKSLEMESLCAQLRDEDGIDPKYVKHLDYNRKNDRKTWQICKLAQKTLNLIFIGETANSLLQNLTVNTVVPFPDKSHLLVTLDIGFESFNVDKSAILAELQKDAGRCRCALAEALNRKKVPRLSFCFR